MKRALMIVCTLMTISATVYSQSRMSEQQKEEAMERYQAFMSKLNLTEEQKPRVEEINREFFEGVAEIRKTNGSRLEKYNTFKKISSTRDKKMKEILTKEQYAIYKENQQEQRENFRERRRGNR